MTNQILMTFVVPIYNAEQYLEECLESILEQNVTKEILCINDGSMDNSLAILNCYAEKYPEIKIINKENEGVAIARNLGIQLAKGKYLWFVDADDCVLCNDLNYFCQIAEQYQLPIVRGGVYKNQETNIVRYYANFKEVDNAALEQRSLNFIESVVAYLERGFIIGYSPKIWSGFYLTQFIKENSIYFPNVATSEDDIFELKCLVAKIDANILETAHPFYFYRDTSGSLSKKKVYERIKNFILIMPEIELVLGKLLKKLNEIIQISDEKEQERQSVLVHHLIRNVNFIYHKINHHAFVDLFELLEKSEQDDLKKQIPIRYIKMLNETLLTLISVPNNSQYWGRLMREKIQALWGEYIER